MGNKHKINHKKNSLNNLKKLYYSNSGFFKGASLPMWMDSYSNWLLLESKNKLPTYYSKYKRGTVVMANFGINVGSEMSFPHFAVVLSNDDNQYSRNVIVVPLSSKFHENQNYLKLGSTLFDGIIKLIDERIKELYVKLLSNFKKAVKLGEDLDTTRVITFKSTYSQIKFLNILTTLSILKNEVFKLKKLLKKSHKYNKETYADIKNITAISKLKINKFDSYNISANVVFDKDIVNKIKTKLNKYI